MPHSALYVDVSARQGVRKSQTLTGAGTPWQHLELTRKSIAQNSVRVITSSAEWTEGLHFQESVHFAVETDGL